MKAASYREAVQWIAENDDEAEMDTKIISGQLTVLLIADIFVVDPNKVAADIVKYRERGI